MIIGEMTKEVEVIVKIMDQKLAIKIENLTLIEWYLVITIANKKKFSVVTTVFVENKWK